jgi:hypothetical protein
MDVPTSFICIIAFFNGCFEYGDGGIFKLLRWMQNLHQSTCDHEILSADGSLEDEQLLMRPLLRPKLCFLVGAFEYGGISKLSGYVGTNAELLCVEFCNFGQSYTCNVFALLLNLI